MLTVLWLLSVCHREHRPVRLKSTVTFTETVSGFTQSDVSLTGSAASITGWSANSDNTVYTATITPTASGTVTVGVAADVATDAAGNPNTEATSQTVTIEIPPVDTGSRDMDAGCRPQKCYPKRTRACH